MKRDVTEADRNRMIAAIASGDRIQATSIYISLSECGLTEAQAFVKSLTNEVEAAAPSGEATRKEKKGWFGLW